MNFKVILAMLRGMMRSETIRFNGIIFVVWTWAVESGLVAQLLEANPNILTVLVYVATIVNAILRVKTDKPLTDR